MPGEDPPADRYLLDVMLGKLAVYLRVCGYDAAYAGDRGIEDDDVIRRVAKDENRHLLSRDRELVAAVADATVLEGLEITEQLAELRAAGVPLEPADPPRRCGRCNGPLEPEPETHGRPSYAPSDADVPCWRCRRCGQYFWQGSHIDDLAATLEEIRTDDDESGSC